MALGNPPWERIKLQEQEFFASRDPDIAKAPNKAARERLINDLPKHNPMLAAEFEDAKYAAEAASLFVRASGRFPFTAVGDVNTYAIFAETFLNLPSKAGRSGFIVPTRIATDNSTKEFFEEVTSQRRLVSLLDFENRERVFPGIDSRMKFSLLTLGSAVRATTFTFFATRTEHLVDERRRFTLSPEDIALINPNTKTCPVFRSQADAELTKKIYGRVPVLIEDSKGEAGNLWAVRFQAMFHMANDSGLFRTHAQLRDAAGRLEGMIWTLSNGEHYLPLFEPKLFSFYDHRAASYASRGDERGYRVLPDTGDADHEDPEFRVQPFYWISESGVRDRLDRTGWHHDWLVGWKEITSPTNERTLLPVLFPIGGASHKILLILSEESPHHLACLYADFASIVIDFAARQKIGGVSFGNYLLKQMPILPPNDYHVADVDFVVPRVLELTYTAWDMQPFARDLGYEGEPFRWDPERRALLRAELDAYYAYLYSLSKKELRYILDPKDVMGEDYPSETFRVLKEREIKEHGEYRTQRLVLEAYDHFAKDGTFDPARLEDPEYFPIVRAALAVSKSHEQELERTLEGLVARTDQTQLPALFVEGETDKLIVEAAWRALFPGEPLPVSILPAGGTTQMRSLATPGRAMRELLGDRLVLALADNDAEGRELWNEGNLHRGGVWKPQTNGVHWCLLKPSDEFVAVMQRFQVPRSHWPFTIENAFPAALRRAARAAGVYAISDKVQSDLIRDPEVAQRIFTALRSLADADDAHLYLMAPTPEAKDTFAAWISDPARLRRQNFAPFEIVLARLKDLLAQHGERARQQRTA